MLAGLIGLVSALTVWAKRQALDTDKWVATSSQLLEDDEIRGALSLYLVDQLYANVDVAAELQARLPPEVKPLAAPIAGGLRELSVRAADTLLSRPAGADALGGGEPPGARGLHPYRRRRGRVPADG